VLHRGKTEAPAAVQGLALAVVAGALRGSRTPSTEADYERTLYRYGASFAAGTPVPGTSDAAGFTWPSPPPGAYTLWAADVDSSGNVGPAASAAVTVTRTALGDESALNNLIDTAWWKQDAPIPWPLNLRYNRIVNTSPSGGADLNVPGPKGGNDTVWYANEDTSVGQQGGGWETTPLTLNPGRTYRFVVPIRRRSGTAGLALWGCANVENIDGSANGNPYFAVLRPDHADRWYLFIGYLYPAGQSNLSNDSAGVWDCKTGAKVGTGLNFRFKAGDGNIGHRAYQYYANSGAEQFFGRPMVNVVDGTEPSLREYFEAGAVLNSALVPSITAAQAAADSAQGTANTASGNASAALARIQAIDSDGILARGEKAATILDWQALSDERLGIEAQGTAYGLTADRNAYSAAYIALGNYLGSLSPGWNDTSADTTIVPATYRATWADAYAKRQALLNAIAAEAGRRAEWAQVGGTGRPADNATVNRLTYSASAPGSAVDGDLWVDLSTNPARIKLRVGGAWQSGATLTTNTNQLTDGAALGQTASWPQVGGAGRPADNATRNNVTYAASAPSSPADGDLWVDTSVTPRVWRARLGGAWQAAASYVTSTADVVDGAQLGLTAVWGGVSGSGKPADNATRNQTYFQDGDPTVSPGGVVDGAIWVSSSKAWQRAGGAWRPYVGSGSVGTGEIAANAATEITQDNYAFGGAGTASGANVQRSFTVTPPVDCKVNFTATIGAAGVLPDSGNYLSWAVSAGGGADVYLGACSTSSTTRQTFSCVTSFAAAAGVALVFKLISDRPSTNPAISLHDSAMRVEVIKR
jgi:hypothetical protein